MENVNFGTKVAEIGVNSEDTTIGQFLTIRFAEEIHELFCKQENEDMANKLTEALNLITEAVDTVLDRKKEEEQE